MPPNRSRRADETYVRVAGKRTYLYRTLDSGGNTSISCCSVIATESQPNRGNSTVTIQQLYIFNVLYLILLVIVVLITRANESRSESGS